VPDEVWAAQPCFVDDSSIYVPEETADYANDTTLDVTPQMVAAGIVGDADVVVLQDYSDDYPHDQDLEDPWWNHVYGFPDYAPEQLAPPEATTTEILAAQPTFTEHLYETLTPVETEDYQTQSPLDTPTEWPPPPTDAELIAAQPVFPDPWAPEETDDYANDATLDVTTAIFSPPFAVEVHIAQPTFTENNEWTFPTPDDGFDNYFSVSPLLDFDALLGTATSHIFQAAQPHYGEWFWPAQETEDYQSYLTELEVPAAFPTTIADSELLAAQPHFGEWYWPAEETEDYYPETTLGIDAAFSPLIPVVGAADVTGLATITASGFAFRAIIPETRIVKRWSEDRSMRGAHMPGKSWGR
jgi:hypothetical protein